MDNLQLHRQFWLLDLISNCLLWLVTAYSADCHIKFQNWSWDGNCIRGENDHIGPPSSTLLPLELRMGIYMYIYLRMYSNLIITCVFLVCILCYKPCHIPLKCSSPIKKSDRKNLNTLNTAVCGLHEDSFTFSRIHCSYLNSSMFPWFNVTGAVVVPRSAMQNTIR